MFTKGGPLDSEMFFKWGPLLIVYTGFRLETTVENDRRHA